MPEQMCKEHDDGFYAELIKYLHGEPSEISPHTVEEDQALIARQLTDDDPELLIPEMREKLMAAIDHAVKIKLTNDDPFVQMLSTHEDDMGRLER
jgi:hypothetical protein